MRKGIVRLIVSLFYSFLGLSLLILIGCGDPGDDPTAMISSLTANPETVAQGESTIITATVIIAVGQKTEATEATETTETTEATKAATTGPANLQNVTFTLETPANGGQLNPPSQKTNGSGLATTTYTAGYNDNDDIIHATLANGSTSKPLIIKKTEPVRHYIVTVMASPSVLTTRTGTSVITAYVADYTTGTAYAGASVAFAVTSPAGVGGATVTSPATTNGSGYAVAYYSSAHTAAATDYVTASTIIGSGTYQGATNIRVP